MEHARPTISTHVLDTGTGQPATGVPVRLVGLLDDGAQRPLGEGVTLEFEVDDATRSWHVPLLVAPYGATTYRGS